MTKHNAKERPRSRAKASSKKFLYSILIVIVLLIIGGFLYWRQGVPRFMEPPQPAVTSSRTASPPSAAGTKEESASQPIQPSVGQKAATNSAQETNDATLAGSSDGIGGESEDLSPATADPQQLVNELNVFYAHLDRQPYMQDFGLKESSKVHFSKLLQKLIDNPPVVVRETDDLMTLLKNTAHFYRILDKENITILKGILDRDRKSLEHILKTFHALTYHPDYLQQEYSLTLPLDALHDYAAFFLNTIGGKLYLFRRDSASRMTVSYYAIQIIDRANREGYSRLGIDLRPSIDSLIEEIENTGKSLKFRDEYLDNLYGLKEKYN